MAQPTSGATRSEIAFAKSGGPVYARPMSELDPADAHQLRAVEGWLDLGNPREAQVEFGRLRPELQQHPAVLELKWTLHAAQHQWETALETARLMVEVAPERPAGWINRSYALHELKRTREAWTELQPAAGRFKTTSVIPYNLACYACQLGDLETSQAWLGRAVQLAGKHEIKRLALKDTDLLPLWERIRGW